MKLHYIFPVLLVFLFTSFSTKEITNTSLTKDTSVHFEDITYSEALTAAKKRNQYVFMNVYATWCNPCMMLKKNTFHSNKVAEYLNENFVNIDVDAEKGEGIQLAKQFNVRAHPLMIIIDSNGKEIKRILGYKNEQQLLSILTDL